MPIKPALDLSPGMNPGPHGPAVRGKAIVPDDGQCLPMMARKLYVGGAGDLNAVLRDDITTPTLFKAVPAGTILDIWVRQVMLTGTTATNLVALG